MMTKSASRQAKAHFYIIFVWRCL